MYLHSTFPVDQFFTPAQLKQQWLDEAADCNRKGRLYQADACLKIAQSIVV